MMAWWWNGMAYYIGGKNGMKVGTGIMTMVEIIIRWINYNLFIFSFYFFNNHIFISL